MKISSNYNLSFNQKVNNQQSKTNPNFGIKLTKTSMLPLAAVTGAGFSAIPKLMPLIPAELYLTMPMKPVSKNKDFGPTELPVNEYGYTNLHYWCENGNFEEIKNFLDINPNTNLSQMTKDGNTYMSLAIKNKQKDIVWLIANTDNYDPAIPNKNGYTDLHHLCASEYKDIAKTLLEKHPDIDINKQTEYGNTYMSIAAGNGEQNDIENFIAGMDNYNPTIPHKNNGWTDLHRLCESGYTDIVKTLLEKHPEFDINLKTKRGNTCMSLAINENQKDIINLIAGMNNYNPAIPNKFGWTDLHRLCKKGYTDIVKTLLKKNPNIDFNQQTEDGDTCMSLAIDNKKNGIINLIANTENYNPVIPNKEGRTDLHRLCKNGYTDIVKILLKKNPNINFNQQSAYRETCMSLAIKNKKNDIINLIANTDNYNPAIPDEHGLTDLHILCREGYTDVVKTLLEKHPNIDFNQQIQTEQGGTCMSFAAGKKQKDIVNLIAGLDNYNPTIPDKDGWTDLHSLCKYGYTDVVKTLLEKHPDFDINQKTKKGNTCMSLAIANQKDDIINLIANTDNYDPTIPGRDDWTDLHWLCCGEYTDIVTILKKKHPNIDFNQQTKNGDTCMSLAIDFNQIDIINLIANTDNYNPAIPNKNGWTDLHRLCEKGYTDVVKTLLDKYPDFDINQQTKYGDTCMSLAIEYKQKDIINLIAGMNNYKPDIPDKDGQTDLHRLCDSDCTDVLETILKNKPDLNINQFTKDGYSCMTIALTNKNKNLVNLIAGFKNYNPSIINKFGANDLHYLCRDGYTEAVKTILDNNPDIDLNQLTKDGLSYIDLAKFKNYTDIVKIISDKIQGSSPEKQAFDLAENDSAEQNAGKETDNEPGKSRSWTGKLMQKVAQILRH